MKVIYKKDIEEKLYEAIAEAKKQGKEIDEIVLTKQEMLELSNKYKSMKFYRCTGFHIPTFFGIKLREEE